MISSLGSYLSVSLSYLVHGFFFSTNDFAHPLGNTANAWINANVKVKEIQRKTFQYFKKIYKRN